MAWLLEIFFVLLISTCTPKELSELLYEKVGFSEKELSDYFALDENDKEWILKVKQWLEPKSYGAMRDLCREKGGAYNPEPPTFHIPKGREAEVPDPSLTKEREINKVHKEEPPPAELPLSQLQNNVFCPRSQRANINDLLESIPTQGLLERLVVRPHPRNDKMAGPMYQIVSGHRRYRALKELGWKEVPVVIRDMDDREARVEAIKSNMEHGQRLSALEEAKWMREQFTEKGMSQEEVGKELGRSQSWVSQRLAMLEIPEEHVTTPVVTSAKAEKIATLPEEDRGAVAKKVALEGLSLDKTKDVVEAIKEVPEKKEHILTKIGVPIKYHCGFPGCKFGTYDPTWYEGVPVCPHHSEQIQKDPTLVEKLKEKPSPPPKIEEKAWEPTTPKPTWPERKQMMHPKVSKMEEAVALALTRKGVAFEQQREFCVRSTKPDFYFPHQNLAVYLDGEEAHKKRVDRDNFLRELLTKRYGVRVLGLTYRDNTQKSKDEILQKVLDEVNTQK